MNERKQINILRSVDFEWFVSTDSVWSDVEYGIPLHEAVREEILEELERLGDKGSQSPPGWVVTGKGGSGKTHLLRTLRRDAANLNAGFVLADMTGVNDFWETVLLEYLNSLHKIFADDKPQYQIVVEETVQGLMKNGARVVKKLSKSANSKTIVRLADKVIQEFFNSHREETRRHQDVIRALLLLNSEDFNISNTGYAWLQGIEIEEWDKLHYGFSNTSKNPQEIVRALSWIMSLRGPTILALDQLDAIVTEHYLAGSGDENHASPESQNRSKAVIESISGGLGALVNTVTSGTLVVVSCLEGTWNILCNTVATNRDRYRTPATLPPIMNRDPARKMVALRLGRRYAEEDFVPEYDTWPFRAEAFKTAEGLFPREILQLCDRHRTRCVKEKKIIEFVSFKDPDLTPVPAGEDLDLEKLDSQFEKTRKKAKPKRFLDQDQEDTLMAGLLETACKCVIRENPAPDSIDCTVDLNFPGKKNFSLLHGRVRMIHRDEEDREEHFCLRALFKTHATAYNNRVKAAMTASGLDDRLKFRRLAIIRNRDMKRTPTTQPLTTKFKKAGGLFVEITEAELRTLYAMQEIERKRLPEFDNWLKRRRHVSQLPFIKATMPEICDLERVRAEKGKRALKGGKPAPKLPIRPSASGGVAAGAESLLLGNRLEGSVPKEPFSIPIRALKDHTAILAGSGSGKTSLIRRVVEEAAFAGIPSIVLDCGDRMDGLGEPLPPSGAGLRVEDRKKTETWSQKIETAVWTPGLTSEKPLYLQPLPDFSEISGDSDELKTILSMTLDGFKALLGPDATGRAKKRQDVFEEALKYFAKNRGDGLNNLLELLSDIPAAAGNNIPNAKKLAAETADIIKARMVDNPLLRPVDMPVETDGLLRINGKTGISVVRLAGLQARETRQYLLHNLAVTLFAWIKQNPGSIDNPVRGLLVIDEVANFAASGQNPPCKAALMQLAERAREFGFGLVLATEAPAETERKIISACNTRFYGRANSPSAIEEIQKHLKANGASGKDVPKLGKGVFYAHSENTVAPIKISAAPCLSNRVE